MSLKAVIFDIDGTLANTLPICIESYRETLQRYVGRPFETEEITRYFGMAEEGILAVYLPEERVPEVTDAYFAVYEEMHDTCKEPFPGLKEAMLRLHQRDVPMAVVTGKGERGAQVTLRVLGLLPYLRAVESGFAYGADKPRSLRLALEKLGLEAHEAVYVGDSAYDIEAACEVGMPVIGAAWAETTTIRNGVGDKALRVFKRIEDFTAWLDETFPGGVG